MHEETINISDKNVFEALCSDDAMYVWYQLRAACEPVSAAAVAGTLRMRIEAAHAALDLLEAAALVRKLRARARRQTITYEVALEELVVLIPDDPEGARRCRELVDVFDRRQSALLDRTRRFGQSGNGEWFFDQVTDFVATPEEIKDLQRRVYELSRHVIELAGRVQPPGAAASSPRHVLQLRVAAVDGEISPMPQIRMLTGRAVRQQQGTRVRSPVPLGPREREIAKLLQGGLSRPEVAKRLGLSPQTVSSYCKRIYEKLGIGRATELGRFSFDGVVAGSARRPRRSARA